ncbi:MAG: HlyD family efflux transporter periplasmic adaptor subunit [Cyclobacteriaceae bacterium]|nr:HlyD family efflux transporter periplasmic adaptor subunit [Cyclobacteriaceae bacterium]
MLNISKDSIEKELPPDAMYSLRTLQTPSGGKRLARILMGFGIITFIILFLPWQQNIHGRGAVTALSPGNRPQTIETAIAGRVSEWRISEGQFVDAGDTIAILSEIREKYFDPQFLDRLREIIHSKEQSLNSKGQKAQALKRQIQSLEEAMRGKIDQAKAKLEGERVRFNNAKNQYERNKKLFEAGNIPLTKFQDIEYKYQGSEADFINAEIEVQRVQAEYLDKINKAESDLNNTLSEQFDTQADLSKLRNEYVNMEVRSQQYYILAPQAGFVVKATVAGIGQTIKEGDALCTIMPLSDDIAVEMYVRAMDVPLLSLGRKVRIEFDGFPALQFSGWPSISVGTFGGTVRVIDYVNTHPGEFRILVTPDSTDTAWPKQLRIGGGTLGWVMLDSVPIWYELWRQLNGFPPSLYKEPEVGTKKDKSAKKSPSTDNPSK